MNKIVFLKILIAFITFLIFLTLGGIVYALINYKSTPKLFNRNAAQQIVREIQSPNIPPTVHLDLEKNEHINDSVPCGNMLCLRIKSDFGEDKVIIFDPSSLQIKAVIVAGQKKERRE